MIRTKDKILAEPNDPNTIVLTGQLIANRLIFGAGNKSIKCNKGFVNSSVLLVSDRYGTLHTIRFDNKTNIIIGTDANGEIVLYDRSAVE